MLRRFQLIFFWIGIVLSACGPAAATPSTENLLATIVSSTLTAVPQPTVLATPAPALMVTLTPTPAEAVQHNATRYAYTTAENVNLRVNPGRLFQVSRVLEKGTRLELLGVLPNHQWINVRTEEGIHGWVLSELVKSGFDGPPPPEVSPQNVVIISGNVVDASTNPVSGAVVGIFQGAQRDETQSVEGSYQLYLPANLSGEWLLQTIAISCTSNLMGEGCICLVENCTSFTPQGYSLNFPISKMTYDFALK